MKKIFLTSSASNVLDKFVELFDCSPSDLIVAFIPTAADEYENKYFVDEDRNKLIELWFKILEINIARKTKKILQEKLSNVDIIFVAWWNTFYLLEKTLESWFNEIIKEHVKKGKYYIGSSAGSILVWLSLEPIKLMDDPSKAQNIKSYEGLKLIDKIILPHYGSEWYQEIHNQILKDYYNLKDDIITLTDNQAIVINGNELKIIF